MSSARTYIHTFSDSLERSHTLNNESDWIAFYKRIWPELLTVVRVDKYSTVQTRGVDRMIWLPNGKQILVDEKCREKDYGDIALEVTSVGRMVNGMFVEEKPGWVVDDSKVCDFVAYAIPSAGKCYMLPFQLLQAAVYINFNDWKKNKQCKWPVDSKNYDKNGSYLYTTRNIGVPWCVLKAAINEQMHRKFGSDLQLPKADEVKSLDQLEFNW